MNRYSAREVISKSPALSRGARLLYTILDEYAREKADCFLKHVTLMGQLKCSKRSLQYWLAELARAGFIAIERSASGGVNRYHMAWFAETVRNEAQSAARGGVQKVARGGAKGCAPSILNTSFEHLPPLPPACGGTDSSSQENPEPTPKTQCPHCSGRGAVLTRVYIRGMPQQRWVGCHCPASVSFGAKAS